MDLWDGASPETRKKAIRWIVVFGVFTLLSSIAIGVAGGIFIASLDELDKTIGEFSDKTNKTLDNIEKLIQKFEKGGRK